MEADGGQVYTGLVAEHYDLLVPDDELGSHALFRREIESLGGSALELACGTGRPLLDFLAAGLQVEGLDSSSEMLALCRRKALERQLEVTLHHQRMESFDLGRRFRTIYVAGSSFMLLPTLSSAMDALDRILRHLEPSGQVLVEMEDLSDLAVAHGSAWHTVREATRGDGATIRCRERVRKLDRRARRLETVLQYQVIAGSEVQQTEERHFLLCWHSREQSRDLLARAGFSKVRMVEPQRPPVGVPARHFVAVAQRP